jgi:hypothetical protein
MSSHARAQERHLAIEAIENVFAELRVRQRPADLWERGSLAEAIGVLFRGAYLLAQANARLTSVRPEDRSPSVTIDGGYDSFDLPSLEKAFSLAKSQEVLPHPVLGPILVGSG